MSFANPIKSYLLILFVLMVSITAKGEPTDSTRAVKKLPIELHKWALQFGVSEDFLVTSFQGSNISISHLLSNRIAFRFGISFNNTSFDSEDQSEREGIYSRSAELDESRDDTDLSLRIQAVRYMTLNKTSLYLGIGPTYQYLHDQRVQNQIDASPQDTTVRVTFRDTERNASGYGIASLVGVEWFVSQRIGIHAEYSTSFIYLKSDLNEKQVVEYENGLEDTLNRSQESDGFQIRGNGVKVGVSVYF